ncbi:MAG: stage II sporulation protein R [Ruminococcus sp.]|nr:stage II sporulation protein R [Ruminococcus sp.]
MKKYIDIIAVGGLLLSIFISNTLSFVRDGRSLDRLRGSVLRMHILADSDSEEDQALKLLVRDELLKNSDAIFGNADSLEEAETAAAEKLPEITALAEKTLRSHGCSDKVTAEIADVDFDERVYGDITMPAGTYRALRIKIGKAEGHNWWCVMYPPLCLPAAREVKDDKETEEEFFDEKEQDIIYHPKKYRLRFAIWDKIKSWLN